VLLIGASLSKQRLRKPESSLQFGQGFLNTTQAFCCVAVARCASAPGAREMTNFTWTFVRDDNGATAIEYALIASLIAMVIITGVTGIGVKLSGYFSEVSSAMK
jgi:pilus assembly protein Flp/PilA